MPYTMTTMAATVTIALPLCFMPPARVIMNAVPPAKHGQASGVVMTARLLGGTLAVAISSALLTGTGRFQVVFLTTAGLMLAALILGWFAIERKRAPQAG